MDSTHRHSYRLYHAPPWDVPMIRSTSYTPQSSGNEKRFRQLLLSDMKTWSAHNNKKRSRHETSDAEQHLPPTERCGDDDGNNQLGRRRSATNHPYISTLPADILGIVAEYYCDNVADAAVLSCVSRLCFVGVLHSRLWKDRVEPLTSRNPFPVNEREHHKWHFNVQSEEEMILLRGFIESRSSVFMDKTGTPYIVWLRQPNWWQGTKKKPGLSTEWLLKNFNHLHFEKKQYRAQKQQNNFSSVFQSLYGPQSKKLYRVVNFRSIQNNGAVACDICSASLYDVCQFTGTWSSVESKGTDDSKQQEQEFLFSVPSMKTCTVGSYLPASDPPVFSPSLETVFVTALDMDAMFRQFESSVADGVAQSPPPKQLELCFEEQAEFPTLLQNAPRFLTPFVERVMERSMMTDLTHLSLGAYLISRKLSASPEMRYQIHIKSLDFSSLHRLEYLRLDFPHVDESSLVLSASSCFLTAESPKFPPQLRTLELLGFGSTARDRDPLGETLCSAATSAPDIQRLAIGTTRYLSMVSSDSIGRLQKLQGLSIEVRQSRDVQAEPPQNVTEHLRRRGYDKIRRLTSLRQLQLHSPFGLLTHFVFDGCQQLSPFPELRELRCDLMGVVCSTLDAFPTLRHRVGDNLFLRHVERLNSAPAVALGSCELLVPSLTHLSSVTLSVSSVKQVDDLTALHPAPNLQSLTISHEDGVKVVETKLSELPLKFLTSVHRFQCLKALHFHDFRLTAGWHAFTVDPICSSFSRAAMKALEAVSIVRCMAKDNEDFVDHFNADDNIGTNASFIVREAGIRDQDSLVDATFLNIEEDWCWSTSKKRVPTTKEDVVAYIGDMDPIKDTRDIDALEAELGGWNAEEGIGLIQSSGCKFQLRRALKHWRQVCPRLKFTILEELDHGENGTFMLVGDNSPV